MKSIDLLVPPETLANDKSGALPENLNSAGLIEKLAGTLVEVVEEQKDANKNLAESFKEAISGIVSANTDSATEDTEEDDVKDNSGAKDDKEE